MVWTVNDLSRLQDAVDESGVDLETAIARIIGERHCENCTAEVPPGGCATDMICMGYRPRGKFER